MLDIDKIQQLVDMMVTNDLVELSLRDGDVEVKVRRTNANLGDGAPIVTVGPHPVNPTGPAGASVQAPAQPDVDEDDVELHEIKSPMVGTYYAAPEPEAAPYVHVGGRLEPNTVVCIVEAMKVYNEIKAEVTGTIERILAKNEEPVEYGQPLFLVRPE